MRFWRWFLIVLVALALVFHIGGGWYFSDQLAADALVVRPGDTSPELVVTSIGDGNVGLRPLEEEEPDLADPSLLGLTWEGGYGQLFEVIAEGEEGDVLRRLVRLEGDLPGVGDIARLDGAAYPPDPSRAFGLFYTDVVYSTALGDMDAWEILSGTGPWVIHVHGLRAPKAEALRLVGPIAEAGYSQLVIDYRNDEGQPQDQSDHYRYGVSEWEDVSAAVDYAVGKGADAVVLVGYSSGAAHVLSYLYRAEDSPVVAAVFDSPNIDFESTVDLGASQRELPYVGLPLPGTLVWSAKRISSIRFDLDWEALDYVRRAADLRVPALIFHGSEDETVPLGTSREFAEARPDLVRLVAVPGAGHVRSWNVGPDAYERRVIEFLDEMT